MLVTGLCWTEEALTLTTHTYTHAHKHHECTQDMNLKQVPCSSVVKKKKKKEREKKKKAIFIPGYLELVQKASWAPGSEKSMIQL